MIPGINSTLPIPLFEVTPMSHEGTHVATDGVNVMSTDATTSGNFSVGPLSDLSQIDSTPAKPAGMGGGSIQCLRYGAGVFMVVDWESQSWWSDDLGATWTAGTGYDPAFNSATAMGYTDRMATFMISNHNLTYSLDGKVKIGPAGPLAGLQATGPTQIDLNGTTYTYYMFTQGRLWVSTSTDYLLNGVGGWNEATNFGSRSVYGVATDGTTVAAIANSGTTTQIRTSTDGVTFGSDLVTVGLAANDARHIMYHLDEWIIIEISGGCWTSPDLINWTSQGDTYLTGTASGASDATYGAMDVVNIIRWGAGTGQSRENFAIFFANQIYKSTTTG